MAIAVSVNNISRIVGYALAKGDFRTSSPNLPQRIALLGEANTANQVGLSTDPVLIISAKQVGDLYGYGSPLYQMARILFPVSGGLSIGSIPVYAYPQLEVGGGSESDFEITVTGAATKNITHKVFVSGRDIIDGSSYDINIEDADTPTLVAAKIQDAINAVLESPVIGVAAIGVLTGTTKWKGLTADEITVRVDTQGDAAGLSYAIIQPTNGSGTPSVTASLGLFNDEWNTIVINPYGEPAFVELETFNGVPAEIPTGRYTGIVFKPFVSIWGSKVATVAGLQAITNIALRKPEVTNALAPAPNSEAFSFEAAANMAVIYANICQDNPNLDVSGNQYPDMPIPSDDDIGEMANYNNRDILVKTGSSTVKLNVGKYEIQDFVTTYHPDGEIPPQFRYPRNLNIDFNVKYGYRLLELVNVVDHSIAESDQAVVAGKVIKPKQWIAIIDTYASDLAQRNLIVEASFMQDSITVETSGTNPDRLNTNFSYKRSPYVRIAATIAKAGFAFGIE